MTDLAALAIKVDSTDVKTGTDQLDKLTAAGARAERATNSTGKEWVKASSAAGKLRMEEIGAALAAEKMARSTETASQAATRIAKEAQAAAAATRDYAKATGLSAHHTQNLVFQIQDIAVGLASGQKPLTVFLQQGAQIQGIMGQAGLGVGGLAKALGGLVLRFAPAIAAAGAGYAAFWALTETVNAEKRGELEAYAKSLGLTAEQIEEAGAAAVTATDLIGALWDKIKEALEVESMLSDLKKWFLDTFADVARDAKKNISEIYAAIYTIDDALAYVGNNAGPLLGDGIIAAANAAITAIEWLINKALSGLRAIAIAVNPLLKLADMGGFVPDVPQVSFGRIDSNGAGAKMAQSMAQSYAKHLKAAEGWISDQYADTVERATKNAQGRLDSASEKAAKQAGSKAGKAAGKSMADEMAKELQYRIPAILKEVAKWGETPIKVEGIDIAKWFEEQERRRQEEAQRHRDLAMRTAYDIADIIGGGVGRAVAELADALEKAFPSFVEKIGKALGANGGAMANQLSAGAAAGSAADSIMGALGIKSSNTGAQIGGMIGSFAGPIGMIGGAIVGGLIGGMLKATPKASATVSIIAGETMDTVVKGNKGKLKQIAGGMADGLIATLSDMADALNAGLGDASVSIGVRKKKYVVDTTGQGRTKGMPKFDTEAEAIAYAVQDAIRDGALAGLAEGFKTYLSSGDIERRLADVLSLQGAMGDLAAIKDPTGSALGDLDKQFDKLRAIAEATGVGLVEVEELYGIKRAEAVAKAAQDALEKARPYREAEIQIMELEGRTREAQLATRALELEAMDAGLRPLYERIYALQDEAEAAAKVQAIADERLGLMQQLWQLEGNEAAIRAQQLATLDPTNRALQEQIWAMIDLKAEADAATKALEDAAAAQKAVADEAYGLQTTWLNLIGDTVTLRARELALLDPTNRALQEQIWAEQDRQAALEEATKAAEAAAAAEKAIADERMGLMRTIWQMTGNTAALRADTLAQLDESNRPLQEYIWALEDAKAAQEAAAAAQEAYAAAEQARLDRIEQARGVLAQAYERESSALQQTIDKFRDFSASIREFRDGLLGQNNPAFGLAQAQAAFASTSRMAGLGSEKALGAFTGDATAYLDAARTAGTYEQYQRAMASVLAGSNGAIRASDGMVSTAQKQLNALEKSVAGILDLREDVVTVAEALADYNAAVNAQIPAMAETVSASIDALAAKVERASENAQQSSEESQIALETSAIALNRIERLLSRMETDNGLAVTLSGEPVNANITNTPLPVDQVP